MHPDDDLTDDQPHLASPLSACSNWIKASLLSGSSYFIPNSFKDSNELKITDFYYYKLQLRQTLLSLTHCLMLCSRLSTSLFFSPFSSLIMRSSRLWRKRTHCLHSCVLIDASP